MITLLLALKLLPAFSFREMTQTEHDGKQGEVMGEVEQIHLSKENLGTKEPKQEGKRKKMDQR